MLKVVRLAARWTMPLLAAGLYAAIAALPFAVRSDASDGLMLLCTLPIALLAVYGGLRAGIASAAVGLGLFAVWDAAEDVGVGVVGYLTRALAFLVVGGVAGFLSDDRRRVGRADTRWFEMSNDLLVEASLDGYFTRLSGEWEECLGWTREELMSRPIREFIHPDDLAPTMAISRSLDERPGKITNHENRYRAKDGSWRWLLWNTRSDQHRKYAVARDITDRKRLEEEREQLLGQVEAMARTDALTGLPNRRSWDEEVLRAMERSRRHGGALALAIADLDDFKLFNDTHGHAAGDGFLTRTAAAWRLALRVTDFLARYGGEEFALLLVDCPADDAVALLDRMRAATPWRQTCSVGVAHWDRTESAEELLTRADAALYEAKRGGRDRVVTAAPTSSGIPGRKQEA